MQSSFVTQRYMALYNKCSAVAEMGDHLTPIDMG